MIRDKIVIPNYQRAENNWGGQGTKSTSFVEYSMLLDFRKFITTVSGNAGGRNSDLQLHPFANSTPFPEAVIQSLSVTSSLQSPVNFSSPFLVYSWQAFLNALSCLSWPWEPVPYGILCPLLWFAQLLLYQCPTGAASPQLPGGMFSIGGGTALTKDSIRISSSFVTKVPRPSWP